MNEKNKFNKKGFQGKTKQESEIVDPKEITHYYVDGGVQGSIAVAAFLKKGFRMKPTEGTRTYRKAMSSTDAEIRAIRIAMNDAITNNIDPKKVVIHTDQKALVTDQINKSKKFGELRDDIKDLGFNLSYLPSVHGLDHIPEEKRTKKAINALRVHELVNEEFTKPHNRYRHHLNKKRAKKRANKGK